VLRFRLRGHFIGNHRFYTNDFKTDMQYAKTGDLCRIYPIVGIRKLFIHCIA
jgi:hypothetical protein